MFWYCSRELRCPRGPRSYWLLGQTGLVSSLLRTVSVAAQHPVFFDFFIKHLKTGWDCCCISIAAVLTWALLFLRSGSLAPSALTWKRAEVKAACPLCLLLLISLPDQRTRIHGCSCLLSSGEGHKTCLMLLSHFPETFILISFTHHVFSAVFS